MPLRFLLTKLLHVSLSVPVSVPAKGEQCLLIRPVEEGDVAKLTQFGRYGLGDVSRAKFAPFDWDGEGEFRVPPLFFLLSFFIKKGG